MKDVVSAESEICAVKVLSSRWIVAYSVKSKKTESIYKLLHKTHTQNGSYTT